MKFKPMNSTIEDITHYFIWFCHEHGDLITNLKLQKLLYYAQGWFLVLKEKPLFSARIEAWIHRPVVPSVYTRFKKYSFNPISEKVKKPNLPAEITHHLDEIMKVFGGCSAYELELMIGKHPGYKHEETFPLMRFAKMKLLLKA